MKLVVRADAGAEIGSGHVMRSRSLAEAMRRRGWEVAFAARAESSDAVRRFSGGMPVVALSGDDDEPSELEAAADGGCDVLLVDHYHRGRLFETACRGWAGRIVVIDDFPNREHDCDLLVDPTAGRRPDAYRTLVPPEAECVAGPMYAPLRKQFAETRWRSGASGERLGERSRLLVSMGATDPGNVTALVLDALDAMPAQLAVDVVLSSAAPHLEVVRRRAEQSGHRVELHVDVASMAELTARADLAVGAAGSAAWERCCLGVPSVLVQIADNQRDVLAGLVAAGAAVVPERAEAEVMGAEIQRLVEDNTARAAMSEAATRLCDGLGAERLALRLSAPVRARDGCSVELRPVADEDAPILLEWQRDPATRRHARNPGIPTPAEHQRWFAAMRSDPRCVFHMLEHDGRAAGFVRLDWDARRSAFEVSIAVAPDKRGLGIGRAGLDLIRALVPDRRLLAYVKPANAASLRLFGAAAYRSIGGDWYANEAAVD